MKQFQQGNIVRGNAMADSYYRKTVKNSLVLVTEMSNSEGDFRGLLIQNPDGSEYKHGGHSFPLNTLYFDIDSLEENE